MNKELIDQNALENICRTCLFEAETLVHISSEIESKTCENISVASILSDIFQLHINIEDELEILPKKICETCFNAICQTYLLRQKMNEAQCVLQEIVSDQVEEKYEIEVDDMDIIENIEYNYEDDIAVEHLIMEEVPPDEIDEPNSYSESKEEIFHETPELSQSPSPIKFEPIAFPFDDTSEAPPEFAREFDKTLQEFDREVALEKCTIYECTRCLLSYKNTKRYLEHMNMHEMEDEKICNICNLQCETTEEYNQHKENHKYDQMFTCVICEEKFDKQLSYKRHIRDAHEENPKQRKRVLCDLCGKAVPSAHSLEIHMRKHTGELPFHCVECDRSFAMEYSFTHHMKLHLPPELLYSCETCGNRFTTPRLLKKHKEIHSGIQPYSCELCGRCFRIKRNFEFHLRSHNGEKPYREQERSRAPRVRRKKPAAKVKPAIVSEDMF